MRLRAARQQAAGMSERTEAMGLGLVVLLGILRGDSSADWREYPPATRDNTCSRYVALHRNFCKENERQQAASMRRRAARQQAAGMRERNEAMGLELVVLLGIPRGDSSADWGEYPPATRDSICPRCVTSHLNFRMEKERQQAASVRLRAARQQAAGMRERTEAMGLELVVLLGIPR